MTTLCIEPWHEYFIVTRGRETFYDDENAMLLFDTEADAQQWIDERTKKEKGNG